VDRRLTEGERIVELVGGRRALGEAMDFAAAFVALIRRGIPLFTVRKWPAAMQLTSGEVECAIRLGGRALARRKTARLTAVESERALRLVRLLARAESVFEDRRRALDWCRRPHRALGREAPLQVLDTDLGARAALEVLECIEFGPNAAPPAAGCAGRASKVPSESRSLSYPPVPEKPMTKSASSESMEPLVKVTLQLPRSTMRRVEARSKASGVNKTTVIRRAIDLAAYLDEARARGGEVLVKKDRELQLLSFP